MSTKALLVFCASALFLQTISGQFIGNRLNSGYINDGCGNGLIGNGLGLGYGNGIGYGNGLGFGNGLGCGNGLGNIAASGGALGVSSASPMYPSGLAVQSENAIGGSVDVAGALPFVSVVALEGELPSAGAAGVQYSCGNGNIGIDSVGATGFGYGRGIGSGFGFGAGFGSGINGFGYGNTLGGISNSCGCGIF